MESHKLASSDSELDEIYTAWHPEPSLSESEDSSTSLSSQDSPLLTHKQPLLTFPPKHQHQQHQQHSHHHHQQQQQHQHQHQQSITHIDLENSELASPPRPSSFSSSNSPSSFQTKPSYIHHHNDFENGNGRDDD